MKTVEDIDVLFPKSLAEAVKLQADEKTRGRLLSGGTDLMVQWEAGVLPIPERAISLWGLPEMSGIRETKETIEIGALATHAQIRYSPLVKKHLPSLAAATATVGGPQIQNRGTLGGNVANASPAGDCSPSLLITNGQVILASTQGERAVNLGEFFTGYRKLACRPDEIIVRFSLPKIAKGQKEKFRKIGPRSAQAISKVMAASRLGLAKGTITSAAIAIGSVAPTAIRLTALENWLVGKKLTPGLITEAERMACEAVKPITDIRSTAAYRQWVTGRLVRAFLAP